MPAQPRARFFDVQLKQMSLVRILGIGLGLPRGAMAPRVTEALRQRPHIARAGRIRAEVPAFRHFGALLHQRLPQPEISAQRFQYMLPRPHRVRIADRQPLSGAKRPNRIRHNPVGGPIAGADHVSGAGRRQMDFSAWRKEGIAVGSRHQLLATFGGAIGIVAAHRIAFAVGIILLAVLVAFVARHHHHGAGISRQPHRIQHARRTSDIRVERVHRIGIRTPHQRLRRQVEHHFRHKLPHQPGHPCGIPNIHRLMADQPRQFRAQKRPLSALRLQPNAQHLCTHSVQPQRQPRTLEPRVPRQPDPFALVCAA